jgi:iron complex outermembrane recepter protein
MKRKIVGLSLSACAAMAFESFELGKIEVTAQKDASFTNESVSVSESVENSSKKKITEVLTEVSGVNIQNSGARNEQMVMVRGFDAKHVPLYIDGIPIAVPYDGYVDFSRFLISDLSEIEVSKGFASPLLGANTFAGAINMVTKRPQKELEAELNTGVFGKNGWSSDMSLGTNQKKYYVQLAMSKTKKEWSELSGSFNPTTYNAGNGIIQDKGKRINSYSEDAKVNLKFALTPNETDEYAFNYIKQWAQKGVPPYVGAIANGTARFWQWDYWNKESLYFISKTAFGDGNYVKTRAFYDVFKNSLLIYTNKTYGTLGVGGNAPSFYDDDTKGVSVEAFFKLAAQNSIAVAAHYKVDTHKEHTVNMPTYKMQDEIVSYGAEYKHKIFANTDLKLGASYDIEQVKRADDSNYPTTAAQKEMKHGNTDSFNPMLALESKIAKDTTIFGGVSQKSRIPSIKDRYSYRFATFIANPNLEAERTTNYEFGVKQKFGSQSLKANVYYMNIEDYIQEVTNVSGVKSQYQNVGTVVSKGVEIDYSAMPTDELFVSANASFQSIVNEKHAIKVTDVPNTTANLSLRYAPTKWFSWTNSARLESGRYSTSNASTRTDAFAVLNTGVGFEVNKYAKVEIGIDNLLDKNYALSHGFPEEGRKAWANLKLKY